MHIFSKLSLATCFIVFITLVSEILNVLDSRYTTIIMSIAMVAQLIILFVLLVVAIIIRGEHGVRITRYQFSDRFMKENEYILPEYVSNINPGKSAIFEILLEIKKADELPEVGISKMCVTQVIPDIKDHVASVKSFIVDDGFILDMDIIVKPGEKINFQLKKDATIKSFLLEEFYIP